MKGKLVKPEERPNRLLCQRCSHQWTYQGLNKFVATCPSCKTSVSISKHTLKGEDNG